VTKRFYLKQVRAGMQRLDVNARGARAEDERVSRVQARLDAAKCVILCRGFGLE
jgi:hypothetical protein